MILNDFLYCNKKERKIIKKIEVRRSAKLILTEGTLNKIY